MSYEADADRPEPGVDRHQWESELESLVPTIEDDPEQALPELADLVGRMLESLGQPDALGGMLDQSEEGASYRAASELADRVRSGADVDPGDVGFAIGELRAIFDSLVSDRRSA